MVKLADSSRPAEIWFVTGSQHLYGAEALQQVTDNTAKIVAGLNATKQLPLNVVAKPLMTTSDDIRALMLEAQGDGDSSLLNVQIGAAFALRACIVNFRTRTSDARRLLATIRRVAARPEASV